MLQPDPTTVLVNKSLPRGKTSHFLFDFDGTISTLRHGWEGVMRPVMYEAITGGTELSPTDKQFIEKSIDVYIDDSTGIQTILQMQHLCTMVAAHGYTKALEPIEYKNRYDEALNQHIAERKKKAADGEVQPFLIPGSAEYLAELHGRGALLMCISGTDLNAVHEEAQLLGVAQYFNGGIYGSVNDVGRYSKKKVIEELIQKEDLPGAALAVTGDGPVEIRCAQEAGGIAIGVTCTESTLLGADAAKYERVAQAGADVIIVDFTEKIWLLEHLLAE